MNTAIFYVIVNLLLPTTPSAEENVCVEKQELSCATSHMNTGDVGTTPPDDDTGTGNEGN